MADTKLTALLVLALLASGAARAGFDLVPPPATTGPAAGAPMPLTPDASPAPAAPQKVTGFGSKVPLLVGAGEIVPPPYLVELAPGVNASQEIAWAGRGRPWRDVLTEALQPIGVTYREDGNHIVLEPSLAAATTAPVAAVPGAPPAPPAPPPVPVERWVAEEGRDLNQVLDSWAKRAGWHLVDDTGREFPIQATAEFTGDFVTAAKALVKSRRGGAVQLATDIWWGNKVFVLTTTTDDMGGH